jgi:hypothetical protein
MPAAITLQFQRVRGLGNRRNAACGICGRVVVAKLVRCQGRHDEQMRSKWSARARAVHYSLCKFGARGIVAIHNLARLAHQLFDGQNQLFGDE